MLEVKNISKSYDNDILALNDVSFHFKKNKRYGIVGETGSGKSTFIKLIAGIEQKDSGILEFNNEQVKGPLDQLIPGHPKIAYLSQDYRLPKFITVEDYLFDPYSCTEEIARKVYESCHIQHLITSDTVQLSGGEKQRVALARQLMKKPELLLLDEPFSNLDHHHKQLIKSTLNDIEDKLGISFILVAHDPVDILSWADEIVVMRKGKIEQLDTPEKIYKKPLNEYVAGLFGSYNLINRAWSLSEERQFPMVEGRWLVRPEEFEIVKESQKGESMTISKVYFMGGYDEVEAISDSETILIRCEMGECQKGDKIAVRIKHQK